jgi:hypothetical protein
MAHPGRATRRARFSLAALVVGDAVLGGLALGFAFRPATSPLPGKETVVVTSAPPSLPGTAGDGPEAADVVAAAGGPSPSPTTTTSTRAAASIPPSTTTSTTVPPAAAESPSTTTAPDTTESTTTTTGAPEPTDPPAPPAPPAPEDVPGP